MRRPEGVTFIAVYQFIVSLPLLIGACAIIGVPISGALRYADEVGRFWAYFGLGIGFLTLFGFALVGIVAGWGLLRLKSWARWLTVILAVLSLPLFPIGTVIGAVIIWYLLQDHVRLAFETGGTEDAPPIVATSVEAPAPVVEAGVDELEAFEDPPYVIPPELDPEGAEMTLLDADEAGVEVEVVAEEVEEVADDADLTLVSLGDAEAQTLIAEVEEVSEEVEAEEEAAAPETIILSEEDLAEAQEDAEATEDEAEDKETE